MPAVLKNISLVASSLDGEVEKPGVGSWVITAWQRTAAQRLEDLSLQMEQALIILFSNWTLCVIQLYIYIYFF